MPNLPPPPPPEPEDLSTPYGPPDRSGWSATSSGEAENLASVGRRVIARIVDFGLFFVAAIVLSVFLWSTDNDGSAAGSVADALADTNVATNVSLILLVVGMAYEVGLIATRGQTIGKIVMNIRVVNADSGAIPAVGSSFVRWAVPSVFALIGNWIEFVGFLGIIVYLSLVWGRRRQGWHDKAANTIVVNA